MIDTFDATKLDVKSASGWTGDCAQLLARDQTQMVLSSTAWTTICVWSRALG